MSAANPLSWAVHVVHEVHMMSLKAANCSKGVDRQSTTMRPNELKGINIKETMLQTQRLEILSIWISSELDFVRAMTVSNSFIVAVEVFC